MLWIKKRNAHAPFFHPPALLIPQAFILVYTGTASQVKVQAISVALIPLTPIYGLDRYVPPAGMVFEGLDS